MEQFFNWLIEWLTNTLAGAALTMLFGAALGALADRSFMSRRIEEIVERKLNQRNDPAPLVPSNQKPKTDEERFRDLSLRIMRCLEKVERQLDRHLEGPDENRGRPKFPRELHSRETLSKTAYNGLRRDLRNLCRGELLALGIERHPEFPGPNYWIVRLAGWRDWLRELQKFSARGELQEAIDYARDIESEADDG